MLSDGLRRKAYSFSTDERESDDVVSLTITAASDKDGVLLMVDDGAEC